jgi:hypothetical protein
VRSPTAQKLALAFYEAFVKEQRSLAKAAQQARQAIATADGDPTWLAYVVYGDPAATVSATPASAKDVAPCQPIRPSPSTPLGF